ncbi:MAG: GDP-mannose 4,6-dehydratase [Anaerolineaceae bacterium]|nr:MAG: GDP-mannose 4,6-dehydratase [Anaerolineaceae bacterium]
MQPIPRQLSAYFQDKQVLITGGVGFIGSNLACHLVAMGADVLLVDSLIPKYGGNLFNIAGIRDQVRLNIADVRDEHGLRYLVQGQDVIFNLAGQVSHTDSMIDPYTDLEINARSQLSLLEACRHGNPQANIVFASTRQIYGRPQYLPVDEAHPLQPVDINGINKTAGEWYHIVYHKVYGLKTVSLRLTNTYGPRMRVKDARQTFLGWWLRQVVENKVLQVFGDGQQIRDFNYVDDVVLALLLAAYYEKANGQIYNLGAPEAINLIELAELMVDIAVQSRYEIVPFPNDRKRIDIGDYHGNYDKIRRELGWEPQISLRDGLSQTLAYYREHLAHYL